MKQFLSDHDVKIGVHPSHRTIYTVANTISTDKGENYSVFELERQVLYKRIYQFGPANTQTSNMQFPEEETAQNVAMRLNDAENKFSGILRQC